MCVLNQAVEFRTVLDNNVGKRETSDLMDAHLIQAQ